MEVRYFKGPRADTCIDEGSSHHATPTSDWHHWPEDIVNRTRSHRDMRPTLIMTWAMAMQMSRNDRTSVKGIGVTNYRVYLQNIRCTTTVVDSSVRTTEVRDACISFSCPKIKNIAVRYSQRRITRATTKSHRSRFRLCQVDVSLVGTSHMGAAEESIEERTTVNCRTCSQMSLPHRCMIEPERLIHDCRTSEITRYQA